MIYICEKYKRLNVLTSTGTIEFRNGRYETEDKKEIAILNKTLDVVAIDEAVKAE